MSRRKNMLWHQNLLSMYMPVIKTARRYAGKDDTKAGRFGSISEKDFGIKAIIEE